MVALQRILPAAACVLTCVFLICVYLDERKIYLNIDRDSSLTEQLLSKCPIVQPAKLPNKACPSGFVRQGGICVPCAKGSFSLPHWSVCKELIDCRDIGSSVRPVRFLQTVGNWVFHVAEWREHEVYYAKGVFGNVTLNSQALRDLHPLQHMLQPIGYCVETGTVVFSTDKPLKTPLRDVYDTFKAGPCDNFLFWFKLCVDYVRTLASLHAASPTGSFVLCNSHTLQQLVDQFYVTTDLHLVLVAYDNLPFVHKQNTDEYRIQCSDGNLVGSFVAPEQKWPFARYKVFNPREQPLYNEKADVWKVPDVTRSLLAHCGSSRCREILHYLTALHVRCKNRDPGQRPNATELYRQYTSVWEIMGGPQSDIHDGSSLIS